MGSEGFAFADAGDSAILLRHDPQNLLKRAVNVTH